MKKHLNKIVVAGILAAALVVVFPQALCAQTNGSKFAPVPPGGPAPPWPNKPADTNKPVPPGTLGSQFAPIPPGGPIPPWPNRAPTNRVPQFTNKLTQPYRYTNPVARYNANPAPSAKVTVPANPPPNQRTLNNEISLKNPTQPGNPLPVNPNQPISPRQGNNRVTPINPAPNNSSKGVTPPASAPSAPAAPPAASPK